MTHKIQELLEKLMFMKSQFQNSQNVTNVGSIEYFHYLGIVQGYEFSIEEIKKAML